MHIPHPNDTLTTISDKDPMNSAIGRAIACAKTRALAIVATA
jgi:hypothetical protein